MLQSQQSSVGDLFLKFSEVCQTMLRLPSLRLWQFDAQSRCVVCLINNTPDDPENGRSLPTLGSFPGDIARAKKVQVCGNGSTDQRFQSWQYKECAQPDSNCTPAFLPVVAVQGVRAARLELYPSLPPSRQGYARRCARYGVRSEVWCQT